MEEDKKHTAEQELVALGVRLVVLHGSRATRTARVDSDYDVAVLGAPGKDVCGLRVYGHLLEALSGLLGVPEERLDVADLSRANPLLLQRVAEHGTLIYGTERDFMALKLKAFHRFVDYQPYFALERALNQTAYAR